MESLRLIGAVCACICTFVSNTVDANTVAVSDFSADLDPVVRHHSAFQHRQAHPLEPGQPTPCLSVNLTGTSPAETGPACCRMFRFFALTWSLFQALKSPASTTSGWLPFRFQRLSGFSAPACLALSVYPGAGRQLDHYVVKKRPFGSVLTCVCHLT